MFKIKEKNKICRKYSQDIWGNLINKKKINKVIQYLLQLKKEKWLRAQPFMLNIKVKKPLKQRQARSRFCKNLDTIKKLSFFCGGIRKKKLKQIIKNARKNSTSFIENFFYLIELRLVLIVYRMNFCKSILEAMQFIYAGYILVNKEVIKQINYTVNIGDSIELIFYKKKECFLKYLDNKKNNKLLLVQPHFIYINYELLFCIIIGNLQLGFLKYPFKIGKQYAYILQKSKL
jgi:ribosomal protein S4